jgi:hypothetical protein
MIRELRMKTIQTSTTTRKPDLSVKPAGTLARVYVTPGMQFTKS